MVINAKHDIKKTEMYIFKVGFGIWVQIMEHELLPMMLRIYPRYISYFKSDHAIITRDRSFVLGRGTRLIRIHDYLECTFELGNCGDLHVT
jgi:hypothetical protein